MSALLAVRIQPRNAVAADRFPFKPTSNRKWERNEIEPFLQAHCTPRQRWLLHRLMDGPLTLRTAAACMDIAGGEHSRRTWGINHVFRDRYGAPAVLVETMDGKPNPRSFWVMKLNPALFALSGGYENLTVNRDYRYVDILDPGHCRILEYVLRHPHATEERIRQAMKGLSPSTVRYYLGGGGIRRTCEHFGLPMALRQAGRTKPHVWEVTPEFIAFFGLAKAECTASLEELFTPDDQKILRGIAGRTCATAKDAWLALGKPSAKRTMDCRIRRIEERCQELGLPDPFERTGGSSATRYHMTDGFRRRFGFSKPAEALEDYFVESQIQLVRWIAEKPGISSGELKERLGLNTADLYDRILHLRLACKRRKLPRLQIEKIGPRKERIHRWNRAFLRRFRLGEGAMELSRRLWGNQRRIYDYWQKQAQNHRVVSGRQAQRDLKLNAEQIYAARKRLNKKLKLWGLPPLTVPVWGNACRDWIDIKDALVYYRVRNGRWPRRIALERGAVRPIGIGIREHFGGIRRALKRVGEELTATDMAAILHADVQRQNRGKRNGTRNRTSGNGDSVDSFAKRIQRFIDMELTDRSALVRRLDDPDPQRIVSAIYAASEPVFYSPTSSMHYAQRQARSIWEGLGW